MVEINMTVIKRVDDIRIEDVGREHLQMGIRTKVDGKVKWIMRQSTQTNDEDKALAFAYEKYYDYKAKLKAGIPVTTHKFRYYANLSIKRMEDRIKTGKFVDSSHYITITKNHLIDFFADKTIHLDDGDIEAYQDYLEDKWLKDGKIGVPANTYKKHWAALRLVFKRAIRKKHLNKSDIPDLPITGSTKFVKRPTWSENEFEYKLKPALDEWVIPKRKKPKTEEYRIMLQAMFMLSRYAGIRLPHEALNLNWSDVAIDTIPGTEDKYVKLEIYGKTGDRETVANPDVKKYLLQIKDIRKDLKHMSDEEIFELDEPIFRYSDGTTPTSWSGSFREFLRKYNLRRDRHGLKRTLYSARSYFIVEQINQEVPVITISKLVGNSIKMIESHYGHIAPKDYIRNAVSKWRESRKHDKYADLKKIVRSGAKIKSTFQSIPGMFYIGNNQSGQPVDFEEITSQFDELLKDENATVTVLENPYREDDNFS